MRSQLFLKTLNCLKYGKNDQRVTLEPLMRKHKTGSAKHGGIVQIAHQLVYTIGKTVLFICNNGVLYGFTHFYYMVNILKTSQIIKGRPDMLYAFLTYMGVDFRGPATFMPQQFLNIPQICPALQQMGGIRVP